MEITKYAKRTRTSLILDARRRELLQDLRFTLKERTDAKTISACLEITKELISLRKELPISPMTWQKLLGKYSGVIE